MSEKTLEKEISNCIQRELEAGVIEKVLSEKLENCISKSVDGLFSYGGDLKKVIEEQIKSTITPYLEKYDYSNYIVKLDDVMTTLLKELSFDNRKILENFSNLVIKGDIEHVKVSDIFKEYKKHCEENIDHDKVDMDYEGGYINCHMDTESEKSSYSDHEEVKVSFTCEEDEELNFDFVMYRFGNENFNILENDMNINSLRYLSSFEIFIKRVKNGFRNIELDVHCMSDDVYVKYTGD